MKTQTDHKTQENTQHTMLQTVSKHKGGLRPAHQPHTKQ